MYSYNCAFRYKTGEVEGFVGIGFTKERAREDAINQIGRKIEHCKVSSPAEEFEPSRFLTSFDGMTDTEKAIVRNDWKTGMRY